MYTNIPEKSINSLSLPVLGFGTWTIGGRMERDPDNNDAADIEAIQNALNGGMRHIDTAEVYAQGRAEELVGTAIRGSDRSKLIIASKVWRENLEYDKVKAAAQKSLERLRTDYLDLYYIHAVNPKVSLGETMKALNELVEEGVIRHIAVSNFASARIDEAMTYSSHPIVCNQVHYNLRYREPERAGLLEYCRSQGILLMAWRPLQYGQLASLSGLEVVSELARKYNVSEAQVAINWLISQDGVVTLVKTLNPAHLQENMQAVTWRMSDEDIEVLRRNFPGQEAVSNTMPLM